jgi:spore coat protein U domain-containing protein, fimbrial subunit CupE1/2/3/6
MLKRYVTVLLAILGFLSLGAAYGASATGNLSVTASVPQTCKIDATTAVAFGAYDPVGANASSVLQATGAVSVKCTKNSSGITIELGLGSNASGTTRQLASSGNFLPYELYQPGAATSGAACAYTTVWGTGTAKFTPSATWTALTGQTFNVCGQIAAAQDVPPGSYTDTVVATVNF